MPPQARVSEHPAKVNTKETEVVLEILETQDNQSSLPRPALLAESTTKANTKGKPAVPVAQEYHGTHSLRNPAMITCSPRANGTGEILIQGEEQAGIDALQGLLFPVDTIVDDIDMIQNSEQGQRCLLASLCSSFSSSSFVHQDKASKIEYDREEECLPLSLPSYTLLSINNALNSMANAALIHADKLDVQINILQSVTSLITRIDGKMDCLDS
ncbi:hypothetical protein NDU88_008304 [Pleurodeles waltl]|uniref:Uncharacterized protein n=1 Tax=Pleurodeles waltl TaxID=8319 RepID=A0AAV7QN93_PLEWA|nr:hypothetical protein NDU88_008304 [Pleurodeles waltl]